MSPRPGDGADRAAPPAFLLFGVFTGFPELFDAVRARIVREYGPLHRRGESPAYPFPVTRTYARSMGPGLVRKFFVPDRLWPQEGLAPVKRRAIEIESEVGSLREFPVSRPINVDPGILNDCRIILASTKDHSHRIYRGDGIWEEVTLHFEKGAFRSLPWTYPDFRAATYHEFFLGLREALLERWKGARDESLSAG